MKSIEPAQAVSVKMIDHDGFYFGFQVIFNPVNQLYGNTVIGWGVKYHSFIIVVINHPIAGHSTPLIGVEIGDVDHGFGRERLYLQGFAVVFW